MHSNILLVPHMVEFHCFITSKFRAIINPYNSCYGCAVHVVKQSKFSERISYASTDSPSALLDGHLVFG